MHWSNILVLIALPFLITFSIAGVSAAPWVPTRKREREALLKTLAIKPKSRVYDLGCGDGSVLFDVEKAHPNVTVIGMEISLLPYLIAQCRKLATRSRVSIRYQNIFKTPIIDADIVFAFLLSKCYPKLCDKFRAELRDNALVAIEAWPIPGLTPQQTIHPENSLPIYLYEGRQFRAK